MNFKSAMRKFYSSLLAFLGLGVMAQDPGTKEMGKLNIPDPEMDLIKSSAPGWPQYVPKRHTKQTYASQRRAAQKRRRRKAKASKRK